MTKTSTHPHDDDAPDADSLAHRHSAPPDVATADAFARADAEYALKRVTEAVRLMAINDLPLRARVTAALVHVATLTADDLPAGARPAFRALDGLTLDVTSDRDLSQLAERLCDLHAALLDAFVALREVRA